MSDVPVELIVAAFKDEQGADDALKMLNQAKSEKMIGIVDAAVIRRDEHNKLHIKETEDPGAGKGAAVGAAAGAIIGLIAGPAGLVVGGAAGAVVGGLAGKFIDSGIPDARLKELGDALKPGTSAIVAIIEYTYVEQMQKELQQAGADVMTQALKADIAKQLAEGKDVAYSSLNAGDATVVSRTTMKDDTMQTTSVVSTPEGLAAIEMTSKAAEAKTPDSLPAAAAATEAPKAAAPTAEPAKSETPAPAPAADTSAKPAADASASDKK